LHFLIDHFSILGFDFQYWMIIGVGVIFGFILLAIRSRR